MSEELKPCPFCGGDGKVIEVEKFRTEYFFIECHSCKSRSSNCSNEKTAISLWNTRNEQQRIGKQVSEDDIAESIYTESLLPLPNYGKALLKDFIILKRGKK